jgi:hypothetical protein
LASLEDRSGAASVRETGTGEVLVHSRGPGHQVLAVTAAGPHRSLDLEVVVDGTPVARQTIGTAREGRAGEE